MPEVQRVSEMPVSERPITRLRHRGSESLTDTEVLALALNIDLPEATEIILAAGGTLRNVVYTDAERWTGMRNIGVKRIAALGAMREMSIRLRQPVEDYPKMRSSRDVYDLMAPRLETLMHEEFHVLLMDSQNHVRRDVTVTRGILNSSLVHAREVFASAITERAAAIILVHNHPSGDPTPCEDDRHITKNLVEGGSVLDIPVHDHVIIGAGRHVSFAEQGLMW